MEGCGNGKESKRSVGEMWERFLVNLGTPQKYFTVEEIAKDLSESNESANELIKQQLLRVDGSMDEVNGRWAPKGWKLTPKGRHQLLEYQRNQRYSQDLEEARARGESDNEIEKLRFDYEQTLATYRMLADIRFKLLAFVPTISGAAIAFLSSKTAQAQPSTTLIISLLGFFVTFGIALYDQRNSQIHDQMVSRARFLERVLQLPVLDGRMGHVDQRPRRTRYLFNTFEIWHDRALAMIYGPVLGAWLFPFCYALFIIDGMSKPSAAWVSVILAVLAAIVFTAEFHRLEEV